LRSFGLTAARFDLLYALLPTEDDPELGDGESDGDGDGESYALSQSELRETLGVCASVVSRMLRSLEDLGFVRRGRDECDRRQKWVELTKDGLAAVRAAYQSLRRATQRLVDEAIGGEGGHRNRVRRFWNMMTLDDYLLSLSTSFGDTAGLHYYWGHPDD
jgi:DNA-binding MarR family transcriptional regulator